jgi:alpha-L-rhamnosidase
MNTVKLVTLMFLTGVLFAFAACQKPTSPATVGELKCEFQENPLGIDRAQPLLQWKMQDSRRGARQTAWQVIVSGTYRNAENGESDIWDSGKVDSDQSVHVVYNGPALKSGRTFFWRVRVWDKDGKATPWSETGFWEMGLLNETDWQAEWIARSAENPGRSVYMRKEFNLENKAIQKARVYVTGLGNYVLFLNGKRVGNDLLTPGWTHYPKRLEYQVYDVKNLLNNGVNAAGAVLGNMWWSGGLGWQGGQKYSEGPLKFLMQLQIEFEDGSTQVVVTDDSWKWSDSPIWDDHIYHGEKYDANLEQPGWDNPRFDDSRWAGVEPSLYEGMLTGPNAPAMRLHQYVPPVALNEPLPGEYVYDLGQNIVGWAQVKINAEKGDTVKFRFAELLHDDGTVAQENLRSAEAIDMVVSNGEELVWEPKFTYHGFRYVQVSGLREKPEIKDLIGNVIYTDQPFIGYFECSNELINSINRNVVWGQKGNFYPAPTDCPQRDERLGWMGDAQIFAPTANFNMHLDRYWSKWMFDITDGQDEEGWVYDVNPPIVVEGPSKPGWGDAITVIPWLNYRYFGNKRIIEDNYEGIKAWVEYMRGKSLEDIYFWEEGRDGWYGYGDWIAVEASPGKPIGSAYYYYSTKLLGEMAKIIGKTSDAQEYEALAERIAAAFQKEYWDNDSLNFPGGTQTANLLPLAFGITPENLKEQVVKNLVENVMEKNGHPTTGFLGTGYILPMLSKYNHHHLAYEMMNKTEYPSWGYMVKQGATTIWELWNSDTEPPEGMNSRNHFALGCVGEWIWNTLGGINICDEHPGFKRAIIKPQPVGDLKWAKAEYETNYGLLFVDWKMENGRFTLNLTVPPNTTAVVDLPGIKAGSVIKEGGVEIGSASVEGISETESGKILAAAGSYVFTVE